MDSLPLKSVFSGLSGILAVLLICTVGIAQEIPTTLSYQGILEQADGSPASDSTYQMTFKLYEDSTGGMPLWISERSVEVRDGVFDVVLGGDEPLDSLRFDRGYWLSVQVESGDELTPRTEFTASPYSIHSHRIERSALQEGANITIAEVQDDRLEISADVSGTGGNTLDQAYDQGGAGAGRVIRATDDAVEITDGNGILGGQTEMLAIDNVQDHAHGLNVWLGNGANTSHGVNSVSIGEGSSVFGGVVDLLTPRPLTDVTPQAGVAGHSDQDGVRGVAGTSTQSDGIFGRSGENPSASLGIGGVRGKSKTRYGVAGISDSLDGVRGTMNKLGTYREGPNEIIAGVHGEPAFAGGAIDNIAVAGTPGPYSSIGVLGIGGGKGHGMIGISGGHDGFTTAGVRGYTTEGAWPPFPLEEPVNKEEVGVLGQAKEVVGVWGESINGADAATGVVGNSGARLSLNDIPMNVGVYGEAVQNGGRGVHGHAESGTGVQGGSASQRSGEAGVRAEGNGTANPGDPRAAALEINNGAVTVSGNVQPAGKWTLPAPTTELVSTREADHNHVVGYTTGEVTRSNDLITENSVIQLTPETQARETGLTVDIMEVGSGEVTLRITSVGSIPPATGVEEPITVHYFIVNPAQE